MNFLGFDYGHLLKEVSGTKWEAKHEKHRADWDRATVSVWHSMPQRAVALRKNDTGSFGAKVLQVTDDDRCRCLVQELANHLLDCLQFLQLLLRIFVAAPLH